LLDPFLTKLRHKAPELSIAVHPLAFDSIGEQFARGRFDLAISTPGFVPSELESMVLMRERYVLAMCASHPLARKRRITLNDFCRYKHIVVSPSGGGFTGPIDDALAGRGRRRDVTLSVPSFSLVPDLLRGSELLCTTPERMVRDHDDIHVGSGPFPREPIDMIAVWHPRVSDDPAHRWLRSVLAAAAARV